MLFLAAAFGCNSDDESCVPDQKVDASFAEVGDSAEVTLDLAEGSYAPFEALDVGWHVDGPNDVSVPTGNSVRGVLSLAGISAEGLTVGHEPVPTLMRFEPDAEGVTSPVEFTTYGCA